MNRLPASICSAIGALLLVLCVSASAHGGNGAGGGHGGGGHGFGGGRGSWGAHAGWGGRRDWSWGGWRGGHHGCCGWGWGAGWGVDAYDLLWDLYLWDYAPYDALAAPAAPVYALPVAMWYYCRDSRAYYPYVQQCASPWQAVPVKP